MPLLKPLEVTIIFDDNIWPTGPKLVVCVEPNEGWFYRFNSKDKWKPCFKVEACTPHHTFLDHDSYLQCGDPLELDDYLLDEGLSKYGIIGSLHIQHAADICAELGKAGYLSDADKGKIKAVLGCP